MLSKEMTFFVIDTTLEMVNRSNPVSKRSSLERGLGYFHDHTATLLLKNRKIDRVGIICASDAGNHVYSADEAFTYTDLRHFSTIIEESCKVTSGPPGKPSLVEAVTLGLNQFKPKIHLKYLRNLVIISNAAGSQDLDEVDLSEYTSLIKAYNINVIFVGIDFLANFEKTPEKEKNEQFWRKIVEKEWGGVVLDADEANESLVYSLTLKKVAPRVSYSGSITFGLSSDSLTNVSILQDDPLSLKLDVQTFPATKIEKIVGHTYTISENHAANTVKRTANYYYKKYDNNEGRDEMAGEQDDDDNNGNYVKVDVHPGEFVPGFKYSNRDIIAVNSDLAEIAQLRSNPGLSIIGFIQKTNLPYAYFTDESSYVIPTKGGKVSNPILFNSFAKALLELKAVALARFVLADGKEINLCVLIPQLVSVNGRLSYSFILVRLALKEDQKIGRFPYLTKKAESQIDKDEIEAEDEDDDDEDEDDKKREEQGDIRQRKFPSDETNSLMDSFILSRDLDGGSNKPTINVLHNQKLDLVDSQCVYMGDRLDDMSVDEKLIPRSTALAKYNRNLKKIIITSLEHDSLSLFLSEEKFVEKYLVEKNPNAEKISNLYHYDNILRGNTVGTKGWLKGFNVHSSDISKTLIDALDVKYLEKDEKKHKRRKYEGTAFERFFRNEGDSANSDMKADFDEFFDVKDLLGG